MKIGVRFEREFAIGRFDFGGGGGGWDGEGLIVAHSVVFEELFMAFMVRLFFVAAVVVALLLVAAG